MPIYYQSAARVLCCECLGNMLGVIHEGLRASQIYTILPFRYWLSLLLRTLVDCHISFRTFLIYTRGNSIWKKKKKKNIDTCEGDWIPVAEMDVVFAVLPEWSAVKGEACVCLCVCASLCGHIPLHRVLGLSVPREGWEWLAAGELKQKSGVGGVRRGGLLCVWVSFLRKTWLLYSCVE